MHIGLPKEIEDGETRVALTPGAAVSLVRGGSVVHPQLARDTGLTCEMP